MTFQALAPGVDVSFTHVGVYGTQPSRRPVVQVEIAGTTSAGQLLGRPVTTTVLVDSGADITMLDAGLAPTLGIDLATCEDDVVGGIGGEVPAKRTAVKMGLCGRWVDVPVLFADDVGLQLLGRDGAFDALILAFVHSHGVMLAV